MVQRKTQISSRIRSTKSSAQSSQLIRRRNRILGISLAALLSLTTVGCANIGTLNDSGISKDCKPATASTTPSTPKLQIRDKHSLTDPLQITGPTTAYVQQPTIVPITDDAAKHQHLPATVTSADGPKQTVKDTSRILALNLNGGLAAAVDALGLGCNLVGRDISTSFAGAERLPVVTENGHELNAESIMALQPTLIITDTTIGPYDVQLQLREAGIPVVFVPLYSEQGVSGVAPQIKAVAAALGLKSLGAKLAHRTSTEIKHTIANIAEKRPTDFADRPRTLFLYVRGQSTYYLFGKGSGADSLIQSLGARDVATELNYKGMSPTNAEAVIKAAPDVIIVMSGGLKSVGGINGLTKMPGIAETPAGAHKRIIDMSDYQVLSFGPLTAQVLAGLATAMYDPEMSRAPKAVTGGKQS